MDDVAPELQKLAAAVGSSKLDKLSEQWRSLATANITTPIDWANIPGQIAALENDLGDYKRLEYVIWRKPWMAVGRSTFILEKSVELRPTGIISL